MVGPSIKGKWIYILYVVEKKWNNSFTTRFTAVVHLCSTSTSVNKYFSLSLDFLNLSGFHAKKSVPKAIRKSYLCQISTSLIKNAQTLKSTFCALRSLEKFTFINSFTFEKA